MSTLNEHEAQRQAATAWLEQCNAELDAALLEHAAGTITAPALGKARRAVEQARQGLDDVERILGAASRREAADDAAKRLAEVAQRWAKARDLMAQREALAAKMEQEAAALSRSMKAMRGLTVEIAGQLPGVDAAALMLEEPYLSAAIHEMFQRAGLMAGPLSLWELERRPSFSERIAAASSEMEARRG